MTRLPIADARLFGLWETAVGTTVTGRPRTDPYVKHSLIRLLPQVERENGWNQTHNGLRQPREDSEGAAGFRPWPISGSRH